MSELWKLLGIAIVILGLALRLRPTIVVVTAGIVTGLLAGISFEKILSMLGRAFADNRLMTLFIITLPAIGLAERYGLQEQAAALIRRFRAASVGRLLILYQLFRVLVGALGLRLNGHPSFVRPLIFPMSLGAAAATRKVASPEDVPDAEAESIKGATAASENYGNFYGQNLSPVQPGILLVYGVMAGAGYAKEVGVWNLVLYTTPIVLYSMLIGGFQFWLLDRRIGKTPASDTGEEA